MQILKTGSFLKVESSENVEALKFTARLLAEHSMGAVKENLTAQQLEDLANNLWRKAEYLVRETERQRLQQIFVENFTERFRELNPELSFSAIENADSFNQSLTSEQVTGNAAGTENHTTVSENSSESPKETDEFLGFVKSDDSFGNALENEEKAAIVEDIMQTGDSPDSQTVVIESGQIEETKKELAEKTEAVKPQPTTKNDTLATNPTNKTSADAKEPFEFGKCTVSLNLTLLASGTSRNRKAIVSVASHNLPPEIEMLEIADGEDLEQIAEIVKDKLARFRGSLPVKYIEQLRAAKNKTAKRNELAKPAVPPAPAQVEKKQPETSQEKVETAVSTIPPQVNQPSAASSIQGSLF